MKYRFTPSLLDKFQKVLDSDDFFESDFNVWSEAAAERGECVPEQVGDYRLTAAECYAKAEQELLDAINRVPHEETRPQLLGTLLNEAVDCILEGRNSDEYPNSIRTLRDNDKIPVAVRCMKGEFIFNFPYHGVKSIVDNLQGAIPQDRQLPKSAVLTLSNGDEVEIYGYPDYTLRDRVIDLKTTGNYSYYKYERYWQRYAYPYIMVKSGEMESVSRFDFLVAQVREQKHDQLGSVTNIAELSVESYDVDIDECEWSLKCICSQLIRWCEENKSSIDKFKTHIYGK